LAVSGEKNRSNSAMTRRLFPHFLLRVAGLPTNDLPDMRASRTARLLREMARLSGRLDEASPAIIAWIEREVPRIPSDALRNGLIQYKRDLFNRRFPKLRAEHFEQVLPPELTERMKCWERDHGKIRALQEEAKAVFETELMKSRKQLQRLSAHPNLLLGIALTSQELFEKAVKYIRTPVEKQKSRLRKVEYSLSKFVSRAAVKTSPFSTFTAVGLGTWDEQAEYSEVRLPSVRHRSYAEINHANILRVAEGLLGHPEVKRQMRYKVNETLIIDGGRVKYIRRVDDSRLRPRVFKTLETPVSLDANPAILLVLGQFESAPRRELPYPELVRRLMAAGRFREEQLHAFLDQLISLQILVPCVERHEQTPDITGHVIRWLDTLSGDVPAKVKQHLERIRDLTGHCRDAPPDERTRLLTRIRQEFREICETAGISISAESLSLLLFEDAILEEESRLHPGRWKSLLDDLYAWQRLLPILDTKFRMQSKIASQFVQMYGEDGVCERPGRFLSQVITSITDYFQSMLPSAMLKDVEIHNEVENVRRLNELKMELGRLIADKMASSRDEAEISREEIEALVSGIPEAVKRRFVTNDVFVQPVRREGRTSLVVNHMYVGNGTFFSRFLPRFRDQVTRRLRTELEALVHPRTLAEMSGVFGFNANLRPPLAPYELFLPMLPATRAELPSDRIIPWNEIILKYDKSRDQVVPVHPVHGELAVMFTGTLIPAMLPFVVNFMVTHFTNGNMPENLFLFAEQNLSEEERQEIRVWPRIRVGDVIVSRKKWVIPRHHLPHRLPKESDFDYFCKVYRWKEECGLPDRVFVRFLPLDESENPLQGGGDTGQDSRNIDFTDWKPQWIDFENPLLVRLLSKLIAEQPTGMVAEEMLPDLEDLSPEMGGEQRVHELVIELSQTAEEE
jgi:hypothetical protein